GRPPQGSTLILRLGVTPGVPAARSVPESGSGQDGPVDVFRPSSRSDVAPFHVMRVLAAAAARAEAGLTVYDLTAGQPSTPAPRPVLAAAHRALDEQVLGYTPATGIRPLREAIAGHYADTYGAAVDPQ